MDWQSTFNAPAPSLFSASSDSSVCMFLSFFVVKWLWQGRNELSVPWRQIQWNGAEMSWAELILKEKQKSVHAGQREAEAHKRGEGRCVCVWVSERAWLLVQLWQETFPSSLRSSAVSLHRFSRSSPSEMHLTGLWSSSPGVAAMALHRHSPTAHHWRLPESPGDFFKDKLWN